ncbi:MAG: CHAT domain-containing protein, partial [Thermoanaerobaculia bacterium]
MPQALANADHALRLDPKLNDALFNRALIIEALGISEAARRAWQRYVAADSSSHWSDEAMHHLGGLRVVTTRDEFQNHLATASRALPDNAPLIALARNYPQEARTWSEGPLLAKWADAFHKGDAKTAAETLTVVRTLGTALAEFNQVQSVADVVATIDHANPAITRTLADAHAIYRDGRVLYSHRRIADAQKRLQEARELFARTGSPMTLITDYYLANCLYDSNHIAEAARALDDVAHRVDPTRYPGLIAEIKWERTLCHSSAGDWEGAIHNANDARKLFSRLGERQNSAEMDMLLASDLNEISQTGGAWEARLAAFPVLSQGGSFNRIQVSLISAMNVDIAQDRLDSALALASLAVDELRRTNQPSVIASAEATRAESLSESGEPKAALAAIGRARLSATSVPDVELRRFTQAAIDIAEGAVIRKANPAASMRLIDSAISFYAPRYRSLLPKAYLERGRTYVRAGNDDAALADFENGLRSVEEQRSSISDKTLRGTFYDTEPALFSEAIELLLRRRDGLRAFEFSDRARARSVYEGRNGIRQANHSIIAEEVQKALPQDSTLVEYAVLRNSIAIFYISSTEKGFVQIAVPHADVAAMVERCSDAIQRRRDIRVMQQTSADLYRLLLDPVRRHLAGIHNLIIVPDRELHGVAFSALYDSHRGRYVLDDFNVYITTNASTVPGGNTHAVLAPVLVVGDPRDGNLTNLRDAATEAEGIAAMYPAATLLSGENATRARFIAASRRSGLIHYAGHANSDLFEAAGSLHLASDSAGSGDLDSGSIAALHFQHAPLVILAACGTIRGNPDHIEGMPSIARAFLAAGARNVIGTLWDVDDESI